MTKHSFQLASPIQLDPLVLALERERHVTVTGLMGSSAPFLLVRLGHRLKRPLFVLTADDDQAEPLMEDARFYAGLLGLSGDGILPFPSEGEDPLLHRERLRALYRLHRHNATDGPTLLFGAGRSLEAAVPNRNDFTEGLMTLAKDSPIERDLFLERLQSAGYERTDLVEEPGRFSVRGGIVDLSTPLLDLPVRIEFAEDRIESLRTFDPVSQISLAEQAEILILPVRTRNEGRPTDHFPPETLLVRYHAADQGDSSLADRIRSLRDCFSSLTIELAAPADGRSPQVSFKTTTPAGAGIGVRGTSLGRTLIRLDQIRKNHSIVVAAKTSHQQKRIHDLLDEHDLPTEDFKTGSALEAPCPSPVRVASGRLSSGFVWEDAHLAVLTDGELFGQTKHHRTAKTRRLPALFSFEDLKAGDAVVHIQHGIGLYRGLKRIAVEGVQSDTLELQYAEGDVIYVPLERLDQVQRYIGTEGRPPCLDRLGGTAWLRTKKRAKRAVETIAKELLHLYAEREVVKGHAFSSDGAMLREFEAAFEYEETPDQLRTIEEVKRDMELPRPMDRLVCGDVGYGKTEVALRAACKAVLDGKQAAMLVPTTLLADQHAKTFKERFAPFPVRVEMLSRFQGPAEQKAVLRDIAAGLVDVVIGTHRLLSKDVRFRDLGLLILDEEQRFGVAQKERLKHLRRVVDVLTLTATPIPRTLQMSLASLRDLSVIETPPPDRLSVRTRLCRFDPEMIREAVRFELHRGGQVFFVHNRIQDLDRLAGFLRELIPEARIGTAHGQMRERPLEQVMLKFTRQEYDVLLSTAIIESGLDIPTANTLLINEAHRFGLADLYQLRGRVGRSGIQAYAYLLVPEEKSLTEEARLRLEAIQEFCELGSGFRIAARDLEIRGAGNLLGTRQSGQIAAVGLELYLRLIEETVHELKGETVPEEFESSIGLKVSGFLPEEYISDPHQRLALYKRLASVHTDAELSDLHLEVRDRYGPSPEPVRNLFDLLDLKLRCREMQIRRLESVAGGIAIEFADVPRLMNAQAVQSLLARYDGRLRFLSDRTFRIQCPTAPGLLLEEAKNCLQHLAQYAKGTDG